MTNEFLLLVLLVAFTASATGLLLAGMVRLALVTALDGVVARRPSRGRR